MRRLSVSFAALMLLASCGPGDAPRATVPATTRTAGPSPSAAFGTGTATISTASGEVVVRVELATTQEARQQGLMHRTELAPDAGMVFLFDGEDHHSFWMKNTVIPLSIAFFDRSGRIVSILDMDPCTTPSCELYPSGAPASGALEVNLGFFEEHGVRVGDRITVEAD